MGRARDKQTFDVTGDPLEDIGPIAVLVDGNTASASEIVTAALKENELATVIGTRTYGKGVFQEVIPLEAGGALDLTVGEYLTADGTSILGKGVVPDQPRRGQGSERRRRRPRRRPRSGRIRAAGQRDVPEQPESGRPRALVVARRGRFWVGEPLFERGPQVSLARGRVKVAPGGIALCRIDQRGGQPIVDLGRADNARDVVGALIADRGLRPTFRDRHRAGGPAARSTGSQRDAGPRRDLTAEPTFTVDPASARDFDDAVSARPEGDGFRVWVHIADVAAHVKPESGLDREALVARELDLRARDGQPDAARVAEQRRLQPQSRASSASP